MTARTSSGMRQTGAESPAAADCASSSASTARISSPRKNGLPPVIECSRVASRGVAASPTTPLTYASTSCWLSPRSGSRRPTRATPAKTRRAHGRAARCHGTSTARRAERSRWPRRETEAGAATARPRRAGLRARSKTGLPSACSSRKRATASKSAKRTLSGSACSPAALAERAAMSAKSPPVARTT